MGAESYILRLSGKQDIESVSRYLTSTLGLKPDLNRYALTQHYSYYVFGDGQHIIECELTNRSPHSQVSLRFALCNPLSITELFVDFATKLMSHLHLTAVICEQLPADAPTKYDASDIPLFAANCKWSIAHAQKEWQRAYGSEEAGLSVSDACRKFFSDDANVYPLP